MFWKKSRLVLICYFLLWPIVERVVWSQIVNTRIFESVGVLFSFGFAPFFFVLHLPLFLILASLRGLRSGAWLAIASAGLGALLAPAQYVAMVWVQNGYRSITPDPEGGWDPKCVWAFLPASALTGAVLGWLWRSQEMRAGRGAA